MCLNLRVTRPSEMVTSIDDFIYDDGDPSKGIFGTLTATVEESASQFVFTGKFVCWKQSS